MRLSKNNNHNNTNRLKLLLLCSGHRLDGRKSWFSQYQIELYVRYERGAGLPEATGRPTPSAPPSAGTAAESAAHSATAAASKIASDHSG